MRGLIDYLESTTKQSILTDFDLQKLREKYFIPEEFQLIELGQDGRITEPPDGCIVFYDEVLWSDL